MSKEEVLVVVGAGSFQVPVIARAKERRFFVVALDANPEAPGFALCDRSIVVDIRNPAACIAALECIEPVAVLALATEVAVVTVAFIAEVFGLKGVSVEAALNSTSKKRMRECFLEYKIPSPAFKAISNAASVNTAAAAIGFPLVVKPSDSAGSRGVSIVTAPRSLQAAYDHALSFSTNGEVLIEAYMDGVEISVESYVQDGVVTILSLSDKIRTESQYPLDTHVIFPSEKADAIQAEAKSMAIRAIEACKIDNAVVHMEMMVTPEGPKMVELAARGAGFHVFSKMLAWVCDINTVDLLIDISLGKKIMYPALKQRGAVLAFPGAKSGIVKEVYGLSDIQQTQGVYEAEAYVKTGDRINELRSGSDRIGHIIVFGDDRVKALEITRKAERLFNIEVTSI